MGWGGSGRLELIRTDSWDIEHWIYNNDKRKHVAGSKEGVGPHLLMRPQDAIPGWTFLGKGKEVAVLEVWM